MKRVAIVFALGLCGILMLFAAESKDAAKAPPDWNMKATIIEACSCPMFCQCYFNTSPAGHEGHEGHEGHGGGHYCKFNNAFKVDRGMYGTTKLDGAKFWVAGDLGGDFSKGHMDWAVVTFDKAMTKEQREAVGAILAHVYPVKWNSLTTSEGDMSWQAGKNQARALLDNGKTAEVSLKSASTANDPSEPVIIKNLKYWGVPSNEGFVLMPNDVEAYRVGDKPFEYKGTNGFMITFDINSKNAPPAAGS